MSCCRARVLDPSTLPEALALRARHPDALPLAGGTDLMVQLQTGQRRPERLLNLWGLDDLRGVEAEAGGLWIGALTTHADLRRHPKVRRRAAALAEACATVGATQIQNRGTLGGNIANASPAGDTLPVLLALEARVEVQSAPRGARLIAMDDLYIGYRRLALAPDELITRVWLPAPHAADRTCFRKVGARMAQTISKVVLGARVRLSAAGEVELARIAFGSVAPIPVRAKTVEGALEGGPPDPAAVELLGRDIHPIDDVRSTATYRMAVASNILRSWLCTLLAL